MKCCVITLFPEMLTALNVGISGRAQSKGQLHIQAINPRDFSNDPHHRVDDRPFGGGPGMVMQYAPLQQAILHAKSLLPTAKVLYLSPQGTVLTQHKVRQYSTHKSLILLAGRYEGIDQRLFAAGLIDAECSIGDYVLSGGELPAMVLIDALSRLLPGVLGNPESAIQDSFTEELLDHPHYTRPEVIDNLTVPAVLMSGDHQRIQRYRHQQSLGKTWQQRPDLLKRRILSAEEQQLLGAFIQEHENIEES